MDFVTCKKCRWVHVLISVEEAERSVERFNTYFRSLPVHEREEYYHNKESTLEDYSDCYGCGSKGPMRWFKTGDCPTGATIQPTILRPID